MTNVLHSSRTASIPQIPATDRRIASWVSWWKTFLAELLCRTTADVN